MKELLGVVVRYTDEVTYAVVMEALKRDPNVGRIEIIRASYPLYKAAAETHRIFAGWSSKYTYVISIDADVIPFPGFGKWILDTVSSKPYPEYSIWLPPLLDWVVQGRWRTAGGIFCYKTEETKGLHTKYMKTKDLVEPEHNKKVFADFSGKEWRPPLIQNGEIVSIHQYGQAWSAYFYRGIIHTLRQKNWIRPNVLLLAESDQPEYRIFLEGVLWGLRNKGTLKAEDASFRNTSKFDDALSELLTRYALPIEIRKRTYAEILNEITPQIPEGMYPINNQ